ncbi:MAG: isochorismate synthase [Acidobacteria bacterium]|nr:isochorismate synthase [Acidobacteriota bacterium]
MEVERPAEIEPLAIGALPFDGTIPAVLQIPRFAVRREESGRAWVVSVDGSSLDPVSLAAGRVDPALPPGRSVRVTPDPDPGAFASAVEAARELIRRGALQKVVLARSLVVESEDPFDARSLVARLRAADPACYSFAVGRTVEPAPATIVGASPELLVSRRGAVVRANPLAGTAARDPDPARDAEAARALLASRKDRAEHAFVVEAARDALAPVCDRLDVQAEPSLLATSAVWHLSTEIRGRLRDPAPSALALAALLHPTPAVCGTPTGAALAAIREMEVIDRGLYAGLVGWVDASGDGEWAVGLRCAELGGRAARLFAGAGIVAGSEPAAEVAETEAKFRPLLRALGCL